MTEPRSPLDQALDVLVYAPIGLVIAAGEELPRLVEKGRAQVAGQVSMARLIGRFAVTQGQREAGKMVKQAARLLGDLGVLPGERPQARPGPSPASTYPSPPPPDSAEVAQEGLDAVGDYADNGSLAEPSEPAATSGQDLAIPGYDALSASQVVQRLAGLLPVELEEVRAYELATRGRRTILNRIGQLQSGPS